MTEITNSTPSQAGTSTANYIIPPAPRYPTSREAKISFGLALFNVIFFFFLHAIIEAFLLGGRSVPGGPLGPGLMALYFVVPPIAMGFCILGAIIAYKDLRTPERNREFALMGLTINVAIFIALGILIVLTVSMA